MAIIVEPCGNCLINGADTRVIDVIGEIDQTQEYHDHRDNAVQQTLTQLNQMRDKRLSIFYRHVYGLSLDEGEGAAVFGSASAAGFYHRLWRGFWLLFRRTGLRLCSGRRYALMRSFIIFHHRVMDGVRFIARLFQDRLQRRSASSTPRPGVVHPSTLSVRASG